MTKKIWITMKRPWYKQVNWHIFLPCSIVHILVRLLAFLLIGGYKYKEGWMVWIDVAVVMFYFIMSATLL